MYVSDLFNPIKHNKNNIKINEGRKTAKKKEVKKWVGDSQLELSYRNKEIRDTDKDIIYWDQK